MASDGYGKHLRDRFDVGQRLWDGERGDKVTVVNPEHDSSRGIVWTVDDKGVIQVGYEREFEELDERGMRIREDG
jgi:hypothetical protein